jgi:hypothetical protein
MAQVCSHWRSQQNGSAEQTSTQQFRSEQPGVSFAVQQSFEFGSPHSPPPPPPPQADACAVRERRWTQNESQLELQQSGSRAQTVLQQASSEQPGPKCSTQQSVTVLPPH